MPTIVFNESFWNTHGSTYTIDGVSVDIGAGTFSDPSEVPSGKTIIIKNGGDLNQESGTRFVNSGTIIVEDSGSGIQVASFRKFTNNGYN